MEADRGAARANDGQSIEEEPIVSVNKKDFRR
jgi:hypothetical protein